MKGIKGITVIAALAGGLAQGCLSTQITRFNVAGDASYALKKQTEIETRFNDLVAKKVTSAEMEAVKVFLGTVPDGIEITEKTIGIKEGFKDRYLLIGTFQVWFPHGGVEKAQAIPDLQRLGIAANGSVVACTDKGQDYIAYTDCIVVKSASVHARDSSI